MNEFKSFALIPAAGMGKRMGASINKQYLQLAGQPILARTLAIFEASEAIAGVVLIIPEDEIPYCRKHVVEAFRFRKVLEIVPGGKERQHSVMNGLRAMLKYVDNSDIILVHDGVRPLVSEELLLRSIETAASSDGALVAVPTKDTIKIIDNDFVMETPDRDTLWQAQTPQTFRFDIIFNAYSRAEKDKVTGTDDSSLVERLGLNVRIVRGDYRNIKITTQEDILLAEAFLTAERQKGVLL